MAAIITEKFRLHNAKQFREVASESGNDMYMFIGRPSAWSDDSNPPTPVDSLNDEFDAYANMVALKKVASTDVSHAIVRRDWTSGTAYDEYRHNYSSSNTATSGASTLWASTFYVMTDDYNVYKCISNNSGANSTAKPDHTTVAIPTESDGYKWKFMYSLSASEVIKFVTSDFIPVKTLGAKAAVEGDAGALNTAASDDGSAQWDVENGAVDGTIEHIRITAAGTGYNDNTYTVAIAGDGSSGTASITVSSGAVSAATINAVGSGYSVASINNATFVAAAGSGNGATFDVIVSPKNGHGADPVEELGGNYVIVNSRLEYAEGSGDFPTDNDFRQIGLIVNPTNLGTTTLSSASTLSATNAFTMASGATMPSVDDKIRNASTLAAGSAAGIVVSVDSTNRIVSYLPSTGSTDLYNDFSASDTVFSSAGGNLGTISSVDSTRPEVQRNSGDIVYIENRGAVARAADQIEDIKLIIEM